MFEIIKTDLAARIANLKTNHGTIQTPSFVPVIHPVKQTIPAKQIKEMGFDIVITNAYITKNSYGDEAIKKGIHKIIDFDKSIMTDSGGYQVLEYGDVPVSPKQIQDFEVGINTDFAIPLDKPTGFGLPPSTAKQYVQHTLQVSKQTLQSSPDNGQIWVGPIQGGEHTNLVKTSTQKLLDAGFKMLALGSPVEFMESYEYKLLAEMIITAKKQMPHSVPLHLFGAGHPLTIPFAVALGCDTFDSASYMLYAKQGRYMTPDGTRHVSQIKYLACPCKICTTHTAKEITEQDDSNAKINNIALHNLYTIKSEVDSVKEAIHEGRLWEYTIKKCRAHPRLYETIHTLTNNTTYLQKTTPRFKEKAMFLYSPDDQFRPEILTYAQAVAQFKTRKKIILIMPETTQKPGYQSPQYHALKKQKDFDKIQICQYNPFLGPIPIEISDLYPAAHYVATRIPQEPKQFPVFAQTWNKFFANNKFEEIIYDKTDKFLKSFVQSIPYTIRKKRLVVHSPS